MIEPLCYFSGISTRCANAVDPTIISIQISLLTIALRVFISCCILTIHVAWAWYASRLFSLLKKINLIVSYSRICNCKDKEPTVVKEMLEKTKSEQIIDFFNFDKSGFGEGWIWFWFLLPCSYIIIHSFQILITPECTRKIRAWKYNYILYMSSNTGPTKP